MGGRVWDVGRGIVGCVSTMFPSVAGDNAEPVARMENNGNITGEC